MKRIMTYAFAAMALAMTLVSCSKENLPETDREKEQPQPQGFRTLTVSFAGATKTNPTPGTDGKTQPVWAANDQIFLADGTATETYTVTTAQAGVSSIEIKTSLQGSVTAVYPANAAKLSGKSISGVWVKAKQNGTFGAANICMAEEDEGVLSFENKTAVFKVKVPAHTTKLEVTSLSEIDETTGCRGTEFCNINNNGIVLNDFKKIEVTVTDSEDSTTCYVAVLVDETNPVLLANLNFDAVVNEYEGSQGGFSPHYLKATKNVENPYALKIEAGTIYNLPAESLHTYLKMGGKKWATRNIGATVDRFDKGSFGYYFPWAGVEGYYYSGSSWIKVTDNSAPEGGFIEANAPYYDSGSSSYTRYTTTGEILQVKDDAACFNWGGAWRMPTGGTDDTSSDYINLAKACKDDISNEILPTVLTGGQYSPPAQRGIYSTPEGSYEGFYGIYFVDSNSRTLFFPIAGGGYQGLKFTYGSYWTSTGVSRVSLSRSSIKLMDTGTRCNGYSVRPVSD